MSSNSEGIQCAHDEKDDCKHTQFALSKPRHQSSREKTKKRRLELATSITFTTYILGIAMYVVRLLRETTVPLFKS